MGIYTANDAIKPMFTFTIMKKDCIFFLSFILYRRHYLYLNSGHLRVLKNLSVIERCPLLGDNFKKIVTFGTKPFVRYSRHVCYLGCPLLGGFTVFKYCKVLRVYYAKCQLQTFLFLNPFFFLFNPLRPFSKLLEFLELDLFLIQD